MIFYCAWNRVKDEVDGQLSSLLVCIKVSEYKATFSLMHLEGLKLDTHNCHLDFKLLYQNNIVIISRKKFTKFSTVGTGLITAAVITGSFSILGSTSRLNLFSSVDLLSITILMSRKTTTFQRSSQLFAVKQEKHN